MAGTALVHRRSFLKGTFALGATLALGSAVVLPSAAPGLRALSAREGEIVAAVAEVLFPGAPFPVSGVEAGIVAEVDRIVDDSITDAAAVLFRYLLRTLEWGTLVSRGSRFTELSLDDRAEVLGVWHEPGVLPRKIAFDALRAILAMAYFSHPEVRAHIGWRAECGGGVA